MVTVSNPRINASHCRTLLQQNNLADESSTSDFRTIDTRNAYVIILEMPLGKSTGNTEEKGGKY
jgi:hypothetical protein